MTRKCIIPGGYQYRALNYGPTPQRFWHASKIALLNKVGSFSKEDIVLDAGCGSGNVVFFLADRVLKVIGADMSKNAIEFARQRALGLKMGNLSFDKINLKKLPYPNESFTKVVLFEVIEHLGLDDYHKIISEIYRVMKNGGELYITTPNKLSLWPVIERFLDTFKLVPQLRNKQHILQLTIALTTKVIIKNGFYVKETGTINHLSPFLSIFSWKLAKLLLNIEIKYLRKFGPILWLVAKKYSTKNDAE